MTALRVFSVECNSLQTLIKSTLNVEKIFQEFTIEGEYYLLETFSAESKHYLVVTVWNSKE
jgi:hypothetical protein